MKSVLGTACASLLSLSLFNVAHGIDYTFTRIAEQTGPFFDLGEINQAGNIVFLGSPAGIYTSRGGPVTTVYDTSDPFDGFGRPSINDSGVVGFRGFPDTGGVGIFSGTGGPTTTVADTSAAFVFVDKARINNSGRVAFLGSLGLEQGVFSGDGGPLTTIADTSGPFLGFPQEDIDINDAGTVAFTAVLDAGSEGLFTGSGGPVTTIADTGDGLSEFFFPSIDNAGNVAFFARDAATLEGAIYIGNGGPLTTYVDTTGPFLGLGFLSMNDLGTVAFFGSTPEGSGIYTGPNPVGDKVIATGQIIDGLLISGFNGPISINNSGQIALRAELQDTSGNYFSTIILATPVSVSPTIDIKPGNPQNPVNPRSNGKLKVAILTTEALDASTVDVDTIQFGPSFAAPVWYRLGDIDADGDWDLVLKFNTQDTGIVCGDTEATLTAQTIDGLQISGTDSLRTVGCP
jgi:hypothetical protein